MKFATYFRACSYAMVGCGTLTLLATGGIGPLLGVVFFLLLVLAWRLEGTGWQLSERAGLIIVLVSLPLFYLDWKFLAGAGGPRERIGIGALSHLILFLSAVKLLQVKAERDWVFIYLISFFEVLLAAGLSISPLYLGGLTLYMLCALSTILAFEIKKSGSQVHDAETRLLVSPDSTPLRRRLKRRTGSGQGVARRLPLVAFVLLILIGALALPLFLVMPRFGGTTWANNRAGLSGFVGFADNVNLGAIGQLQQSNQVAFRVRVEPPAGRPAGALRWRGVALDYFTGRGWRQSQTDKRMMRDNGKSFYQFFPIEDANALTKQTFYLEPIDTPYLFGAARVMALQGSFSSIIRDPEEGVQAPHDSDRATYTVFSDTREPDPDDLRADDDQYAVEFDHYLQTPAKLDPRIKELAGKVTRDAGARGRYDQARALEKYLQTQFGYTLDLQVGKDGRDPLPDFLFNIRAGHCEYFATAMVIMLRTQGIAARVVNGFQTGEYNDTANVYTVTQADAHSWVEAYFPRTRSWVTFDPTPDAGHTVYTAGGIQSVLGKYAEALQMLWVQYVVGYDKTEQQTLTGQVQSRTAAFLQAASAQLAALGNTFANWWKSLNGQGDLDPDTSARMSAVMVTVPAIMLVVGALWLWRRLRRRERKKPDERSPVEFYERLMRLLAAAGFVRQPHQTPLEFATTLGDPNAFSLTQAYNRVRFGGRALSAEEAERIEYWLKEIERGDRAIVTA
jgi:hypothetical protein